MALFTREEALEYHRTPRHGKTEVVLTKRCESQKDLSLAYSPGVAEACKAIAEDQTLVSEYTGRANLVAVISDGTAVLGLGNIGPYAAKPVMEGKGVLFKNFADVDVFDLCLKTGSPEEFIAAVKTMEPTFGGINLEDIKAPECFVIEETLKKEMNIPVFHDDQHGTAIISGAALLNACELTGRRIEDAVVVVVGAGAAGMACSRFYCALGVKRENIRMFDSKGLIHKKRAGVAPYKMEFAQEEDLGTLADCMKGADLFLGLSTKNLVSQDMVRSMADKPILFAMANPDPGNLLRGRQGRPARLHHGDGPLRLPEPDQQRVRLPLHLPRRARCGGHGDQRGHEDRRCPRAGRSRQGTRPRRGLCGLQCGQPFLRLRLHHPQAARSAHPDVHHARRGQGRHGDGRRPQAYRRP